MRCSLAQELQQRRNRDRKAMSTRVVLSRTAIAFLVLGASACSAGDNASDHQSDSSHRLQMSLDVSDEAHAKDVGLPAYPRSKPYLEDHDSSSGANLGLDTPWFGFKVVAL